MKNLELAVHETDTCPEATEILEGLKAYNVSQAGPANRKGLTISVKQDDGQTVAGLIGHTHWDWLFVSILWVKEEMRGQNLGTKIIAEAEKIAKSRGCKGVHLDTFDFQAPGFYEKLGFQKFGEIPDCPVPGKKRIFYQKRL
jgi:ribosomal protein S18 acetylase RimI-like enzyme